MRSRVRQVLLVRNALLFDPITMKRIQSQALRARYLAQRLLAIRSIRAAQVVLFPSRAMLDLVATHVGGPGSSWCVAPYGARHDMFAPTTDPERSTEGPAIVLNVSLYCDQKNLGTLFGAFEVLHARSPGRQHLRLTAGLRSTQPGPWHPNLLTEREALARLERAGIAQDIEPQRYGSLPDLYWTADVFVFPSYTESFGHPLVEAMATGLPIVAADVPVNREMCGEAALYFSPFDSRACADAIARVVDDRPLAGARCQWPAPGARVHVGTTRGRALERPAWRLLMVDVAVIILTYNEERNVAQALRSVCGWARQVFVFDSFSTDRKTLDVVRSFPGCLLVQHRFEEIVASSATQPSTSYPSRPSGPSSSMPTST